MAATMEQVRTRFLAVLSAAMIGAVMFCYQPAYETFTRPMLEGIRAHL